MLFIECSRISAPSEPIAGHEGLMVGFFLAAGCAGGLQQWWLNSAWRVVAHGAVSGFNGLTAITDNAALPTCLLVQGTNEIWRYMLVAGAVTGGGLTVIANA